AGVARMGTQGASLGAWPAPIVQPNGCLASIRTSLGAPPPLRSGLRSQNAKPGRKTRRGNEMGCAKLGGKMYEGGVGITRSNARYGHSDCTAAQMRAAHPRRRQP